jgi:hypothetical protein
MKVKASKLNKKDLKRIKQIQLNKIKSFVETHPFVTLTYIALKTKIPMKFILDNKKKIENYFPKSNAD